MEVQMSVYWIAELPDNRPYTGSDTRIAIDSGGVVHLLYVIGNIPSSLRYAEGTPGQFAIFQHAGMPIGEAIGQTYSWWTTDINYPAVSQELFDLAVDSKGGPHLCFVGQLSGGSQDSVIHAVWDETAGEFARTVVVHRGAGGLAMTLAKDDSVHIAYVVYGVIPNQGVLFYATRARESDPFNVEEVDQLTGLISNLSIAVGSAGKIGISYIFAPQGTPQFFLRYAETTAGGWRTDTAAGPTVIGVPPYVPGAYFSEIGTNSLVIDGNGVPHIAYFADGLGLRHATWTSAGWGNWLTSRPGPGETVDPAGQSLGAKILLDQSNVLHIAYQAKLPGGTTELRLATSPALGGWATTTIDPSVNSGWGISAALGKTGLPHISYGFFPMANGPLTLKHIYALNIPMLPPPPWHKMKRPIIPLPR
jgi:hypothetical protein